MDTDNAILDFAKEHSFVMLGAVGALVLMVVVLAYYCFAAETKQKPVPPPDNLSTTEIDELIAAIHDKQRALM